METNTNNTHICAFDNIKMDCLSSITTLLETYKQNDFALRKIHRFCTELLANSVTISIQQNNEREEKMNMVREKSETFITNFLDSYPQYYYFQNNTFVNYDGETFSLSSEDQISNRVVMMLSMDADLSCRKHKIKSTVIKRIRDRGTNFAVPSSQTIQSILKPLYPSIFETRNETKYFLTIIGDILNKKSLTNTVGLDTDVNTHSQSSHTNSALVYFAHHRIKAFIDFLVSGLTFLRPQSASTLSNTFKYKFQNHSFANARVIRIQGCGNSLYYPNLNVIDFFFVAQYYSNRYGSSEELLQQMSFANVAKHALILNRLENENNVVEWFTKETMLPNITLSNEIANSGNNTIQDNSNNIVSNIQSQIFSASVDTKTLKFMWKRFCQKNKIPNVIQSNTLIDTILKIEKFAQVFDKHSKKFVGYTANCLYNPAVGLFMEFWEDTITVTNSNSNSNNSNHPDIGNDNDNDTNEYETDAALHEYDNNHNTFIQLEIDELSTLFNSWIRKKGYTQTQTSHILEEEEIITYIKHFHPEIEIIDDKFINGICCSLWDKYKNVNNFIENALCQTLLNEPVATDTSAGIHTTKTSDNLYRTYCQTRLRTDICIASKGYFEKVFLTIV